eukprot:Lankesteria_metandrocarpae@DN3556_c0_g1_i1.p1
MRQIIKLHLDREVCRVSAVCQQLETDLKGVGTESKRRFVFVKEAAEKCVLVVRTYRITLREFEEAFCRLNEEDMCKRLHITFHSDSDGCTVSNDSPSVDAVAALLPPFPTEHITSAVLSILHHMQTPNVIKLCINIFQLLLSKLSYKPDDVRRIIESLLELYETQTPAELLVPSLPTPLRSSAGYSAGADEQNSAHPSLFTYNRRVPSNTGNNINDQLPVNSSSFLTLNATPPLGAALTDTGTHTMASAISSTVLPGVPQDTVTVHLKLVQTLLLMSVPVALNGCDKSALRGLLLLMCRLHASATETVASTANAAIGQIMCSLTEMLSAQPSRTATTTVVSVPDTTIFLYELLGDLSSIVAQQRPSTGFSVLPVNCAITPQAGMEVLLAAVSRNPAAFKKDHGLTWLETQFLPHLRTIVVDAVSGHSVPSYHDFLLFIRTLKMISFLVTDMWNEQQQFFTSVLPALLSIASGDPPPAVVARGLESSDTELHNRSNTGISSTGDTTGNHPSNSNNRIGHVPAATGTATWRRVAVLEFLLTICSSEDTVLKVSSVPPPQYHTGTLSTGMHKQFQKTSYRSTFSPSSPFPAVDCDAGP